MMIYSVFVIALLLPNVFGSANIHGDSLEKLITANTKFAVDLYHEIVKQPDVTNVVFSPVSVAAALAMLKLGTAGNSTNEIEKALYLKDIESSLVNSAFGELNGLLFDKTESNITLKGANGAFVGKNSAILKDYKNALSVFGAEVEELDFKDSAASVAHINDWIAKKTGDYVKDMLDEDAIDGMTSLILANTLYFNGEWHSGFNPKQTIDRAFFVSHYKVVKTPFMYQRGKFKFGYVESLTLQVLEMPYVGQDISMIILMPDNFDFDAVEKNLNHENLKKWIEKTEYTSVDLTFPKFKLDVATDLQTPLQNLGISDIFSPGAADLSGITGDKSLHVDDILHKSILEVEPLGGLVYAERDDANKTPRNERVMYYADHPFMFIVKNMKTDVVYLFGALKRPAGKEVSHDEL